MDFVETEGDTIDAAIENALKLLGVDRDRVTIEIVSEGRKGILGFGAQKAKIRAELRGRTVPATAVEPEPDDRQSTASLAQSESAEKAKRALTDILQLMGVKATVQEKSSPKGDETILEVRAGDSGLLIGRKGQTLEALQYLVTRIAGERQGSEGPHIVVDVENYRERRRRSLEDMALRLGEKAKRQRKTVTVDALSAADRRIIHAALQDDPWLSTKSLGQGAFRRLLIIPEGDRRRKDDAPPEKQGGSAAQRAKATASSTPADADEDA
ncbi:MAG TPA: RNA-binding cell elongation regulator Jag/EloR [Candidatus Binatia bacterium]|nr:RNA-binding cell elongation regulator Jag/EloR [Candidatus Binatia bacterium]